MNKHDIEELQSFLQGDYIEESTSRSLKEVKQHQRKQNSMFNDKNKQQLKNFLRNKLSRNGRNSLVCNIRKDIDCKTDDDLAMFNILKNTCDRYHGYTKHEKIDGKFKRTKSDTYTAEKMRICELFGLDGKKYGIEEEEIHDDWIYLKFNEFNNIGNIFPVNKRIYYRFIHFTKKKSLVELSPTLGSSHFNSGYANDTVFFFAIKRGAYMPDVLRRGLNYGENAYEYIPKANDKIYLDFTDTKPNMRDSVIPVYIETKRALPVKKIEFDREGFKESYIDETIERFDAFMEEFNNGQIGDSEFIMESVQDNEYAKIVKDYMKKRNQIRFTYRRKDHQLPKEVEDRIFDLANKLINFPPNGDYSQYKMYYKSFCKIVNYPCDSVIMGPMINRAKDGFINMGEIKAGSPKAKRCMLKPGTHLFHTSENPNLTMLTPDHFKGRENNVKFLGKVYPTGDYDSYYAAPRAYFHVEKIGSRQSSARGTIKYDSNNMPIIENKPTSEHVYMYIVKPGDKIFFDPELNETNSSDGAVYMLVNKPIKLIKIY